MQVELKSNSASETKEIGRLFSHYLKNEDIVVLNGELGAGKTTFIQGIAAGLGIKEHLKSPTFTIHKTYNVGKKILHHIDAYRLENDPFAEELFDDFLFLDGITLIEWGENFPIDPKRISIKITIEYLEEETRKITIESKDERLKIIEKEVEK